MEVIVLVLLTLTTVYYFGWVSTTSRISLIRGTVGLVMYVLASTLIVSLL